MDYGHRLMYPTDIRRLVGMLAVAFAVVVAFQYFELPYGTVLSSLLSTSKASIMGMDFFSSLNSEPVNHTKGVDSLNSTTNSAPKDTNDFSMITKASDDGKGKDRGSDKEDLSSGYSGNGTTQEKHPESTPEGSASSSKTNTELISKNVSKSDNVTTLSSGSSPPLVNLSSATSGSISISMMNEQLLLAHSSSSSQPPKWSSPVDEELLHAKEQIQKAQNFTNDSGLYAPLYRNVAMFERSYELMEKMLKVYIYKEGEKPIFHDSILEGIYSSEGWFIKLMEANKHFVTEDPARAHLFYLPFSSRLLQLTLYVPNSHKRSNLIEYMQNYVQTLSVKYPFWNRTGGADHFLAACHDWAPAETRGRISSCLRALCNADLKAGFVIGKDVSLPTTYVRSAQNPLKGIEGDFVTKRPILAFFAGYMHGHVRPILLKYWGDKDPDMKIFSRLPPVKGNKNYIEFMKSSKYCICARGFAVHSPRVVESIFYGCVPVIISDDYVPPFFEVLDWESFAVFVMERDIPNLKMILDGIAEEKYVEMKRRVREVQKHFLWHAEPVKYDLFHMVLHSIWYNRVFQMKHI